MKRLLSLFLAVVMLIGLFAACSPTEEVPTGEADKTHTENKEVSPSSEDNESPSSASEPEGEYSLESFMELYDEYEAEKGKDKEKEEELLAKMQIILESQQASAPLE